MGLSTWHILAFLLVALVLFGGRGKISHLMGDFAEGIKAFKKGMQDDDKSTQASAGEPVKTIDHKASEVVNSEAKSRSAS
ncbi:MAG TPA: twin-arginine translocase TatA/TatE family subunit [Xanthobacteraceae bacterium]|jgi:sec-independent protein translocase protein TatA|nr:twin-arginine translocase TatA/TatE family subunit [Xanthobacteraceae bacterium]